MEPDAYEPRAQSARRVPGRPAPSSVLLWRWGEDGGPLWLRSGGRADVKEFLRAALGMAIHA